MTYLLDANVFIQAKNLHYGFDFCPAFWEWLDRAHAAGTVYSIEEVRTELKAGSDELSEWAEARPAFFLAPDEEIVRSLRATSDWAAQSDYDPAAVNTFLQVGDYYLVAHATRTPTPWSPMRSQPTRGRRSRFRMRASGWACGA